MTTLRFAVKSDVGRSRTLNEDDYLANGNVFAVADGMGGHQAGEVASEIAVQTAQKNLNREGSIPDQIKRAFKKANSQILNKARKNVGQYGMGTTLTMAIIDGDDLWIGHIGDSRAYLYSDKKLYQVTEDHSLVARLVENGEISEEEARNHPKKNVITKAIGSQTKIEPDIFSVKIKEGDRILLCTDGLTGMVEDDEINSIISKKDPEETVNELVARANTGGGLDNVTVIAIDVDRIGEKTRSSTLKKWLTRAAVATFIIATLIISSSYGLKQVYFLAEHEKNVAIYRGLPLKVGGYAFFKLEEPTNVSIDKLPNYYRKRMEPGIVVGSLKKTKSTLKDIASLEAKD